MANVHCQYSLRLCPSRCSWLFVFAGRRTVRLCWTGLPWQRSAELQKNLSIWWVLHTLDIFVLSVCLWHSQKLLIYTGQCLYNVNISTPWIF